MKIMVHFELLVILVLISLATSCSQGAASQADSTPSKSAKIATTPAAPTPKKSKEELRKEESGKPAIIVESDILDEIKIELAKLVSLSYSDRVDPDGFRLYRETRPFLCGAFGKTEDVFSIAIGADAVYYIKGKMLDASYEDSTWKVDLDRWKTWLEDIDLAAKETVPYTYWGASDSSEKVEVKQIGKHKYVIRDSYEYFSESWERSYSAYSSDSSRIIEVKLFFEYPDRDIPLVKVGERQYEYTVFGKSFLSEFEKLLP